MNVVFLTLFLGLVSGPEEVRVAVGTSVAAVEIRLDGLRVAELTSPGWKGTVDFGPHLLPHSLEAVGFDREGREIGRTGIAINLPRPLAEAAFVFERPDRTGRQTARLTWESPYALDLGTVRITLDGQPLAPPDPSRFEIPPGAPDRIRILRAELRFGNDLAATAEAFVGGKERDYSSADLTAIPVLLTGRRELPPVSALAGWFACGGMPLQVVAAEDGPADVVFLVDPEVETDLRAIAGEKLSERPAPRRLGITTLSGDAPGTDTSFLIPKGTLVQFAVPAPQATAGSSYSVYPIIGPMTRGDGGLPWLYFANVSGVTGRHPRHLARAAELASLAASRNARRRAAVWIFSDRALGEARSFESARRYLRALNVPLFVWRVSRDPGTKAPVAGVLDASTAPKLDEAIAALSKALSRQRMIWVEGRHLPQTVVLSPAADGIEIAR